MRADPGQRAVFQLELDVRPAALDGDHALVASLAGAVDPEDRVQVGIRLWELAHRVGSPMWLAVCRALLTGGARMSSSGGLRPVHSSKLRAP